MKYLDKLREQLQAKLTERAAALAEMAPVAEGEERSEPTAEDLAKFDAATAKVKAIDAELPELRARIAELEEIERQTAEVAKIPALQVVRKANPMDVLEDRSASRSQLADALTRSIEDKVESPENLAHARKIFQRHAGHGDWARQLIVRSTPAYEGAFMKLISGREMFMTPEEQRAAMSVGSSTNGGNLVPTHLDPTVILTNNGTSNAIRPISRVVTLTTGNTWNGITSAGVSSSWDGELVEVSDDSPTFAKPSISTHMAQTFVQWSIPAEEDIAGLYTEVLMMLADARDRLEAAAHATGSGSGQPFGIFTALDANTNVELTSTTAATIGVVDLHAMYAAVPVRWRSRSTWLMNPVPSLAIKALGTTGSGSAASTTDLSQAPTSFILNRPVVESDDAPNVSTTTALDLRIVFGDFSNYVVVDMPGSMAVERIQTLFNTANNLPDGRRGAYAHWRTGADSVNDLAFRLLLDKTSA